MTDFMLWPATNGPNTASDDAQPVTTGVEFKTSNVDRYVKGIRYYRGTTDVAGTTAAVWVYNTGAVVSGTSVTFADPTTTGWQTKLLTAPYPQLTPGTRYVAGVHFPGNSYTATAAYWSAGAGSAGIGDADVFAPGVGESAGGQGKYVYGSPMARPTENGNGANFWVDILLSDTDGSGGGDPDPDPDPDPEPEPGESGTVAAQAYGSATVDAFTGRIDWVNGAIVATLHTSSMTPNLLTHSRVSSLTHEIPTGHGYTQGDGQDPPDRSATFTAAASLAARENSTAYQVGDLVRPATPNGHLYRCQVAGTSGSTVPSWPTTAGADVTDGSVVWGEFGRGVVTLTCGSIPFGGITGTARYLVFSDRSENAAADQPLIALVEFEQDESGQTTFTYHPPAGGVINIPVF